MTTKEQKEALKNGKDVEFDNIIVLQKSLEEKKLEETKDEVEAKEDEKTNEEVAPVLPESEQKKELPTPDVKIPEVKNEADNYSDVTNPFDLVAPEADASMAPQIDMSGINFSSDAPKVPSYDPLASLQQEQVSNYDAVNENEINNSYGNEDNYDSTELFNSAYSTDEESSRMPTIVSENDEISAKKANLSAYERLYDDGPGKQIKVLRKFSEESSNWIELVNKNGFVSGEMHDLAKKILNDYRGLKTESDEFTDNKGFSNQNDYNAFDQVNVTPYSEDNKQEEFNGNSFAA